MNKILLLTLLLLSSISVSTFANTPLPSDSIYQIDSQWKNQDGKTIKLEQLAGKKQLVSMIYTHCLHTCPTIVATMQAIEKQYFSKNSNPIGFVLISLTPDSDTPKTLKEFAEARKLSSHHWTLLTGSMPEVRNLAMALNIKFKGTEDNEVAHSNLITVLDDTGVMLFQELGDIAKAPDITNQLLSSTPAPLPSDSIYQLDSQWKNQDGKEITLAQFAGKKQLFSMIYTHCLHTCPTIVSTMQAIEKQYVSKSNKEPIGFVLISLTPDSDTPKALKAFAKERKLSSQHWTLLTGDMSDVRNLAMALNVKFKNTEDNEVAHSNLITALNASGKVLFQEQGEISKVSTIIQKLGEPTQ